MATEEMRLIPAEKLVSWHEELAHPLPQGWEITKVLNDIVAVLHETEVEKAKREISQEWERKRIDLAKEKLRQKKWHHRLFPWQITITRR